VLKVVLDTNVVVAGLRSRNGASFVVLDLVARGELQLVVNAPLMEEYEEVLYRPAQRRAHGLEDKDLQRFLGGLVAVAEIVETRLEERLVLLRDVSDAIVAEAAIDGHADYLVTHNLRHFAEVVDRISVATPGRLLRSLVA
jgi:putative PIN family toxin of toxin-antitoxin system